MQTHNKEIFYNIICREVHNLVGGIPVLGMFEQIISNYLMNAVAPYIDAFTGENQKVDINQLTSYMEYEFNNKISKFKEVYSKEMKENGDGDH